METLFAVASLRVTRRRLGVEESLHVSRASAHPPVEIPEALRLDLGERVPGATFHEAKRTLNLAPERVASTELPGWVEARLREAIGDAVSVAEEARR